MKKLIFVFLVLLTACYYDNEEDLYPDGSVPCDTTNVTFSATVLPIIEQNCFVCHASSTPQGNIYLGDYDGISQHAQIPAGQPGSLYGAITHNSGNSAMPQGLPQLSDCNIRKIKIWIDAGTPNN